MFNFLVTASDDTWEQPGYEYPRVRFLEYISDEIAESFRELRSAQLAALALPSGAFLLFAHDATLDEEGTPKISVQRIAVTDKMAALRHLDQLNINESTDFPYIENSTKYLAQKFSFRSPASSACRRCYSAPHPCKQRDPVPFKPRIPAESLVPRMGTGQSWIVHLTSVEEGFV